MEKASYFKKTIWLLAIVIGLSSCDSSSSDDDNNNSADYFIKAKIDGEEIEFKGFPNIALDKTATGNGNQLVGSASQSTSSNFPSFSFEISDPTGIKVKTYTQAEFELIFRYSLSGTNTYHSQAGQADDFQITITEITDNHLKGTFSGTITEAINGNETLSVTDGQFFTKRQLD